MESVNQGEKTCIFCGKKRTYNYYFEDGYDYDGHHRGSSRSWNNDTGCDCVLGKTEHNKAEIKKMCLNCNSYNDGYCTNEKELEKISTMFDVGFKVSVKTPTRKCEYWKLNNSIFTRLLKEYCND